MKNLLRSLLIACLAMSAIASIPELAVAREGRNAALIAGGLVGALVGGAIVAGSQAANPPRYYEVAPLPEEVPYYDYAPEERYEERMPRVVCDAQNRRGIIFRAYGYFHDEVQKQALYMCEDSSRYCRRLGCQYY